MNFLEALQQSGVEVHERDTKPGEYSICCPFCTERGESADERFRLGVNLNTGFGHCFNCSWSSKNNTLEKILDQLAISVDYQKERIKEKPKKKFSGKLPDEFELLYPKKKDRDFMKAYNYLRKRGVSISQIKNYKIGFCLAGDYAYRIVFPVIWKNKLVGLVSRSFIGREPRYLNSLGSKALYRIRTTGSKTAILVEGIIKKLVGEQIVKKRDWIALLGRTLRDSQVKILKRYYKKVIYIPDNNRPGYEAAIKIGNKLVSAGLECRIGQLPLDYEDVDEAKDNPEAVRDTVKNAWLFSYEKEIQLKLRMSEFRNVS